jgi:endonuclease III
MKNATEYAARVRKLFTQLKRNGTKLEWPESDGPLEHLMVAILSEDGSPTKARAALSILVERTVDLNDLRVSTPQELANHLQEVLPEALPRTTALVQTLNSVYERENTVALESLKGKGKRETRAYLDSLVGVSPYAAACTLLWGYGDHAVAVDEVTLAVLKKEELVAEDTTSAAAQSFLERHIRATESEQFTILLKRYAGQKAPRPKKTQVTKKTRTVARRG